MASKQKTRARRSTTAPVRRQDPPAAMVRMYAELQRAADDRRRDVARRLHDSAQQTLAAASMSLALLERAAGTLPPAAHAALTEAMHIIARCNQELRDISQFLYPPLLDGLGLGPALKGLNARWGGQRMNIQIDEPLLLPDDRKLVVYKLIEEAVEGIFAPDHVVQLRVEPSGDLSLQGLPRRPADAKAERATIARLRLRAASGAGQLRISRRQGGARSSPQLNIEVRFRRTSSPK
jgi:glucose-6-phosphate-specific signal transduction histidine kinase